MKKSSQPKHDRDKAPADEVLEILFQENACGDVFVTMPNGEIFMLEPDAEDAYHRETILAGKVAAAVSREVATQSKRLLDSTAVPVPLGVSGPKLFSDSPPKRKRGRPAQIPEERKKRALAVQGARARAEILYATRCPTPQQKKNVSAIIRHFLKNSRPSPDQ